MNIRRAKPGDVPVLQKLWLEFMAHHRDLDPDYRLSEDALANWGEYLRSKFDNEAAAVFVANDGGAIVGYIGALIRDYPPVFTLKSYGFIEEIVVTRHSRRKGVASLLWTAAEEWLLSMGIDRIKVNIDCANPESQGFFRSKGFLDSTETLMKTY